MLLDINRITHKGNSHSSAFGINICDVGKYHWKFKIGKCGTGWALVIGIWNVESSLIPPKNTYFTTGGRPNAYGIVSHGYLVDSSGGGYDARK